MARRRAREIELRVVADTNVLVSGLTSLGPPARILDLALDGVIDLLVPTLVGEELLSVLAAKFGWSQLELTQLDAILRKLAAEIVTTPTQAPARSGNVSDDRILAAALEAAADILVTGDRRHLLPLGQVDELRLLTPQALLQELHRL